MTNEFPLFTIGFLVQKSFKVCFEVVTQMIRNKFTSVVLAQVVRVTTDITDITDITMVTMDMTRDTIVGTTEEAGMVVATEVETEVEMEVAMEVVVVTEEVGAIAAAEIDIPSLLWLHQHLYSELPR
ncbi:hypothetical protein L917_13602 [Phytophthora nicotianae]|uniref:Uncharacterized protein n=1 Tax=Phytophthora nicotianae TaxID=4792 RepID=W2KPJ1_PHYNI|nr:hypothetical protein L917_13602 [Phytophthora nicotianae]